jgi:DsbC/DsbD-like thiol-disulfide interchange protein
MLLAGLRVRLAPRWKTYWRMPGSSGIPPQIDWSQSDNVKSASIQFPVPRRFADTSGETIGYYDEVVFPIMIAPEDTERPVILRIVALIGVCRDICIPVRQELTVRLPASSQDLLVATWLQRVPKIVPAGETGAIAGARLVERGAHPVLILSVAGEPLDIFIESETDAYFGKPEKGTAPQQWQLPVSNLKDAGRLAGKPLVVTVAYADKAVEQRVPLG